MEKTDVRKATIGGKTVPEVEEQAKKKVQSLKEEAVDRGRKYIEQRKGTAADFIKDFADAMETAAGQLEERDRKTVGSYIRSASREMQRWSSSLRDYGVDMIAEQVQTYAGRHPGMVLGGAAVAGFAVTRVFRSVERAREPEMSRYTPTSAGTGPVEEEVFRPTTPTDYRSSAEEVGPHS